MTMTGIVTMVLVLSAIWGGFGFFLYQNVKQDRESS